MEEKAEYLKLQEDMVLLQSGNVSEELLDKWCKEIDEEEKQKEEEAIAHAQWLKERELRKQEIERVWRPLNKTPTGLSQKRKAPDSLDSLMDLEMTDENQHLQPQEMSKPALSPLLTSLLKSPSQAQNVANSSILHSAITSQRSTNSGSNPTIASLLNSSTAVNVSPGLQQLVTTAITQEPNVADQSAVDSLANDILEESVDTLPNIKVEDLESTILSSDDPLPEIKNEEVEVIISDLIQNADIVSDPEQHLQLDDNEDIITNLDNELQELCNEEQAAEEAAKEKMQAERLAEKPVQKIDPFEFEEDPEICQLAKPSSSHNKYQDSITERQEDVLDKPIIVHDVHSRKDSTDDLKMKEKPGTGSVEIVEVVVMEETEIEKQLNKSQIQDIVHSIRDTVKPEPASPIIKTPEYDLLDKPKESVERQMESPSNSVFDDPSTSVDLEVKSVVDEGNKNASLDINDSSRADTFTPEYSGSFFDDISMEVNKLDKSGKAKRDYSRTKKRESEKEFDILLAVEKVVNAQLEANKLVDDNLSEDNQESEKKFDTLKPKIKIDTDRSNSPWTEEEEMTSMRNKRRYSASVTPIDSVPNSPASSSAYFEDDREYRNWKKSVMLVYSRLTTHKYSSLFLKPITDDMAPGYHSIVYRPMDLQTIRKNIENGAIRTTLELQRDVMLMFTNAVMYNKTNELVYNMAKQMQQESIQQIQILLQAQQGDIPPRRETRTSEPTKRKRPPEDNSRNKKRKED
ncbi:hypothetical protein ILUMI_27534 [Ignelater luminosus]|uniref:Bromo domain-containing protein n=1 Tax=Ignelater luminosus TaxID=2038154 RepID=A0A8K0FWV7_IGNLU|nr:hypothetical protein ILUMI_27534 [Ignelater luminosus]